MEVFGFVSLLLSTLLLLPQILFFRRSNYISISSFIYKKYPLRSRIGFITVGISQILFMLSIFNKFESVAAWIFILGALCFIGLAFWDTSSFFYHAICIVGYLILTTLSVLVFIIEFNFVRVFVVGSIVLIMTYLIVVILIEYKNKRFYDVVLLHVLLSYVWICLLYGSVIY